MKSGPNPEGEHSAKYKYKSLGCYYYIHSKYFTYLTSLVPLAVGRRTDRNERQTDKCDVFRSLVVGCWAAGPAAVRTCSLLCASSRANHNKRISRGPDQGLKSGSREKRAGWVDVGWDRKTAKRFVGNVNSRLRWQLQNNVTVLRCAPSRPRCWWAKYNKLARVSRTIFALSLSFPPQSLLFQWAWCAMCPHEKQFLFSHHDSHSHQLQVLGLEHRNVPVAFLSSLPFLSNGIS